MELKRQGSSFARPWGAHHGCCHRKFPMNPRLWWGYLTCSRSHMPLPCQVTARESEKHSISFSTFIVGEVGKYPNTGRGFTRWLTTKWQMFTAGGLSRARASSRDPSQNSSLVAWRLHGTDYASVFDSRGQGHGDFISLKLKPLK